MKVVDLHPDDLFDKEARGELTGVERARLDAHLERCETCRFERDVRDDFADELFMGEDEVPSQRLLPLLEPGEDAPPARISTRPSRMRRNLRVALLVAAALMIGSAATAGMGGRVWAHVASALSLESAPVGTPAVAPATTTAPAALAPSPRQVAPVASELVVPETSAAAPIVPVAMQPAESAATLFEQATKARNAGDYGRAVTLHRKLETAYPNSREAHTSYATLGRLLLDRGDAMAALAAFDRYQAKGPGPLDEAVLVGRATSLERLGRDAEARASWTELLHAFPDTPYREHARTRLGLQP